MLPLTSTEYFPREQTLSVYKPADNVLWPSYGIRPQSLLVGKSKSMNSLPNA